MSSRKQAVVDGAPPAGNGVPSPSREMFFSTMVSTLELIAAKLESSTTVHEVTQVQDHVWDQLQKHYPHIGKDLPVPLSFDNKRVILVPQFTLFHLHMLVPVLTDVMLVGDFGVPGTYLRGYAELTKKHFPLASHEEIEYLTARVKSIGRLYILHRHILNPPGAPSPDNARSVATVTQLLSDARVHISEMDTMLTDMDAAAINEYVPSPFSTVTCGISRSVSVSLSNTVYGKKSLPSITRSVSLFSTTGKTCRIHSRMPRKTD